MDSLPHELYYLINEYTKNALSELTKYKIDIGTCSKNCIKLYVRFIPDGCPDKNYYQDLSR
jgi:hypothetical protein